MKKSYFANCERLHVVLRFMRLAGIAFFLLGAIGAFIGWVLFQAQEPLLAAQNGIPDTPWHLWIRYLNAAAVLYYLPRWRKILQKLNTSTSKA